MVFIRELIIQFRFVSEIVNVNIQIQIKTENLRNNNVTPN